MLTIGDFSRLSRVTPRMLRHYDALGLLCPQAVGENGYRYYRQEQLVDLTKIQWLRGYGFSLGEIGALMALEGELEKKKAAISQIETDILRMEGRTTMENEYRVILLEDPEQKVFSLRRTIGVEQYHDLFNELRAQAARRGLKQSGPIQMLYHDPGFNPVCADVEVQMVVAQEGPDVTVKPACTCAAVQHSGPYESLHQAYAALCAWLGEHTEYRVCGPAMDRYLNDPHDTPPDRLKTGVLFPVEKAAP